MGQDHCHSGVAAQPNERRPHSGCGNLLCSGCSGAKHCHKPSSFAGDKQLALGHKGVQHIALGGAEVLSSEAGTVDGQGKCTLLLTFKVLHHTRRTGSRSLSILRLRSLVLACRCQLPTRRMATCC